LIKMTEMAIKLKRLTGLSVSRTSDFAKPDDDLIDEFLANPKGL
jgi:allantoin racemase